MDIITAQRAYDITNKGITELPRYTYSLNNVIAEAIRTSAMRGHNKCKVKITKSFHATEEYKDAINHLESLGYNTVYSTEKSDTHSSFIYRGSNDTDINFGAIIINWENPDNNMK